MFSDDIAVEYLLTANTCSGWKCRFTITQAGRGFQAILLVLIEPCYTQPMQRGTIYKKHNAWYVVYRIEEIVDGEPLREAEDAPPSCCQ